MYIYVCLCVYKYVCVYMSVAILAQGRLGTSTGSSMATFVGGVRFGDQHVPFHPRFWSPSYGPLPPWRPWTLPPAWIRASQRRAIADGAKPTRFALKPHRFGKKRHAAKLRARRCKRAPQQQQARPQPQQQQSRPQPQMWTAAANAGRGPLDGIGPFDTEQPLALGSLAAVGAGSSSISVL